VTTEDCVTVTGNAGTGKTALIRHIALELLCQRYEIVPVNDPQEIEKYYDDNVKQVFIIDEVTSDNTFSVAFMLTYFLSSSIHDLIARRCIPGKVITNIFPSRVTRRVSYKNQELLILREHLGSPHPFSFLCRRLYNSDWKCWRRKNCPNPTCRP
jgi:SpoVK/Ycf46/Vps4 family AAA+-type ATPase